MSIRAIIVLILLCNSAIYLVGCQNDNASDKEVYLAANEQKKTEAQQLGNDKLIVDSLVYSYPQKDTIDRLVVLQDLAMAETSLLTMLNDFKSNKQELFYLAALSQLITIQINAGKLEEANNRIILLKDLVVKQNKKGIYKVNINNLLGDLHLKMNEGEDAISYYKKAIHLSSLYDPLHNPFIVDSYVGLGTVHRRVTHDFDKSITYFLKALELLEKGAISLNHKIERIFYGLSSNYRNKGDYEVAEDYIEQALTIVTREDYENITFRINCQVVKGNIYYSRTDFEKALVEYNKIIDYFSKHPGDNATKITKYLPNQVAAYLQLGKQDLALSSCHKSLNILKKNTKGDNEDLARIYYLLGIRHKNNKQVDSSYYYFNKSLLMRQRLFGEDDKRIYWNRAQLGMLAYDEEKLLDAINHYQKALHILVDDFNENDILSNPSLEQTKSNLDLLVILGAKGRVLRDMYIREPHEEIYIKASNQCFKLMNDIIANNKTEYNREGSKLFISSHFKEYFESAIDNYYLLYEKYGDKEYFEYALKIIENNKSTLLYQDLIHAENNQSAKLSNGLLDQEAKLKEQLAKITQRLGNAAILKLNKDSLQSVMFKLRQDQNNLSNQIRLAYPDYFRIKYDSVSTSLANVSKYTQQHNGQIVNYFWGKNNLFIMRISGENRAFKKLPITDSLSMRIDLYQSFFEKGIHSENWSEVLNAYQENANFLYNYLLHPVIDESLLKQSSDSRLVVIGDGPLSKIPFESLIKSTGRKELKGYNQLDYLINYVNVSYGYSLELLTYDKRNEASKANNLLAFGYSEAGQSNQLEASSENFLLGSIEEINQLKSMFQGMYFMGKEANEFNFKKYSSDFDVIHLAIHGISDEHNRLNNKLIFNANNSYNEDDTLHTFELLNLDLHPSLIVLSACETGVGKSFDGEGTFSISRSFIPKGNPSIINSLWKVNDRSSSVLMRDFYINIADGNQKSDLALHNAKLAYLQNANSFSAHPWNWASLVHLGKGRAINISPYRGAYSYLFGGLIVVVVGLVAYLLRSKINKPVIR